MVENMVEMDKIEWDVCRRRQMPTVAFALDEEYVVKLEDKTKRLGITKSDYLRRIIKAALDVKEEDKHV